MLYRQDLLLEDRDNKPIAFLASDMPPKLKENLEHVLATCFALELDHFDASDGPDFDFKTIHFGCYGRYCLQVSGFYYVQSFAS